MFAKDGSKEQKEWVKCYENFEQILNNFEKTFGILSKIFRRRTSAQRAFKGVVGGERWIQQN